MAQIWKEFDPANLASIDRIAPERQRAEFIQLAVKEAICRREYDRIREGYLRQPDTPADADSWSSAEEWKT